MLAVFFVLHCCSSSVLFCIAFALLPNTFSNLEDLLPRFGYEKGITPKDELIHLVSIEGCPQCDRAGFLADPMTAGRRAKPGVASWCVEDSSRSRC